MAQDQAAILLGKVFSEDKLRPIAGAKVTILEIDRSANASEKGEFRIVDVAPGTLTVRVRHIGFARFEARIAFKSGSTIERAIVLPILTPLDTLRVVGEANVPLSFLEHKAAGISHFFTRQQLE